MCGLCVRRVWAEVTLGGAQPTYVATQDVPSKVRIDLGQLDALRPRQATEQRLSVGAPAALWRARRSMQGARPVSVALAGAIAPSESKRADLSGLSAALAALPLDELATVLHSVGMPA